MDRNHQYIIIVIILVVAAGLFLIYSEGNQGPESSNTESDDGKASQTALISVTPKEFNQAGENVSLPVDVFVQIRGYPELSYDDVQLCFYSEGGEILAQEPLGTISSPDTGQFSEYYEKSVELAQRPTYIIVDHPELRNDSRFQTEVRYWADGDRRVTYKPLDEIQDEFDWPRTDEVGKCG